MLVVMALPIMVACGDDDDNDDNNNNIGASYTEAEIVELFTGKWEVYGEVKATFYEADETYTDNYKGTIEFKADKSVKFKVTDGTKYKYTDDGQPYETEYYVAEILIGNNFKYTVLKKGGKNYISFDYSSIDSYPFEIVSITKNTFMLRLDDDIIDYENKSKPLGHIYMTIVSN